MQYADLVQFEPIESVVQLRTANKEHQARRLVSTYVISEQMAEKLNFAIFPQLQFERPEDNMGILIVGNYGTGKSHLMSAISAVAEHGELASALQSQDVMNAAEYIAGRFSVLRTEIGSSTMPLRDIVTKQLEQHLDTLGIEFAFPPSDEVISNKTAFEDMMTLFGQRFPDKGLFMVVDELLDYLRGRKDLDLILDLSFLREVGEVCRDTRFRFMAGLQEMLFDNPRFDFVAPSLLRVKDRFDQVRIARKDVQYVVSERLLKKKADQQVKIADHLEPYLKFYGGMNERIDEFVRLFPVHPDYLTVFERISHVEKRQVLKTLSTEMKRILQSEVPENLPGLISYDSYWDTINNDPSFHMIGEVGEVIDRSRELESRIDQGFTRPAYKPMALRIIHALAIQRLTTGDIYMPIGPTAEELRDGLCLYDPSIGELGGDPAEDLLTQVKSVLQHVMRTVSGQYISHNPDNGQYYLDLKKSVDYDARITRRAESMGDEQLDRYYYDALRQVVLEEPNATSYVTGYQIWEYELEWTERRAMRQGYLFFGAPNERSTAVPQRDFYLYFLQPYGTLPFKDEKRSDEVFFKLRPDQEFYGSLRCYAAARDLAATAAGEAKEVYARKAGDYLKRLNVWLREHMTLSFDVTYKGTTKVLLEWIKARSAALAGPTASVRDLVNSTGSACLASWFADQAPDYPRFSLLMTAKTRAQAAQDALRAMRPAGRSQQGVAVLDALQLLDGDELKPDGSKYARHILGVLARKGQGQVVNRDELIEDERGVEYMAPHSLRLEPEWIAVLLAALVYSGDAVLAVPGGKFDASAMDMLITTPVQQLMNFKHIEQPRDWPVSSLKALFELIGQPTGMAQLVTQNRPEPVQALQGTVAQRVTELVLAQQEVQGGFPFWGSALLDAADQDEYRKRLAGTKTFLESLQAYNTPGKLKNLRYDSLEIEAQKSGLDTLGAVAALKTVATDLGPLASYLSQAEIALPVEEDWVQEVKRKRRELLEEIRNSHNVPALRAQLQGTLDALKKGYIARYIALHGHARLGIAEDRRKAALLKDPRLTDLRRLASIELMPTAQLNDLQTRLTGLRTCSELTDAEMQTRPICPHCGFKPVNEPTSVQAASALDDIDGRLDMLLESWTATLRENLRDPITEQNLHFLPPGQRGSIERFEESGDLPDPMDDGFVEGVQEALKGFIPITITIEDLRTALGNGGSPTKVEDVEQRFSEFLAEKVRGKESKRVRIILE